MKDICWNGGRGASWNQKKNVLKKIPLKIQKISPLKTKHYLYLSGTPFRAINSGEFIEEQIYNWTYSDEQKSKLNWSGNDNPYLSLPRMVMMTYQMPENINQITDTGEYLMVVTGLAHGYITENDFVLTSEIV